MRISDAAKLIQPGVPIEAPSAIWADLGCGSGTFTNALATFLGASSRIYAMDKVDQIIRSQESNVTIEFLRLDFVKDILPVTNLDGILMANALHYVKDKDVLIKKLTNHLKSTGQFIIVEYDTEQPNQWVPYPISFTVLHEMFSAGGFNAVKKIGERKSVYRAGKMYAAVVGRR